MILVLTLVLLGCRQKGDYQYVIQMKDGTKVKAWSVESDGGGLFVIPSYGNGRSYFLSSSEYIRADFVGFQRE